MSNMLRLALALFVVPKSVQFQDQLVSLLPVIFSGVVGHELFQSSACSREILFFGEKGCFSTGCLHHLGRLENRISTEKRLSMNEQQWGAVISL